jgi:glutathione peroxidase
MKILDRRQFLGGVLGAVAFSWAGYAKSGVIWSKLNIKTLLGKPFPVDQMDKKLILFVNVASRCGYTPQYASLQKLHDTYKGKGLLILGVPCNQFGGQEPGSPEEIQKFCKSKYSVDFPILQKQDVNGANRSALYEHLISNSGGRDIRWNFEKILVTGNGKIVKRFSSSVEPMSAELIQAVAGNLPQRSQTK